MNFLLFAAPGPGLRLSRVELPSRPGVPRPVGPAPHQAEDRDAGGVHGVRDGKQGERQMKL